MISLVINREREKKDWQQQSTAGESIGETERERERDERFSSIHVHSVQ